MRAWNQGRSGGACGSRNAHYGEGVVEAGCGFEGGTQVVDALDDDRGGDCERWKGMLGQYAAHRFLSIMAQLASVRPILRGVKSWNGHIGG